MTLFCKVLSISEEESDSADLNSKFSLDIIFEMIDLGRNAYYIYILFVCLSSIIFV